MLIDTHTHICDERLVPERKKILQAVADGESIGRIIEVAYDIESSKKALCLAQENERVFCAVGIHPHDAEKAKEEDFEFFKSVADGKKVVAIGEIGLDYFHDLSPRDVQKKVLARQLVLAYEVGLPVILHLRDAYEDMYNVLIENKQYLGQGVLLHCYSGSVESVARFREFDAYFAFGGATTFKNAKKDDVIKAVPKDRLLVETDCPYLTPEPFRGRTNKPQYAVYVAQKLASVLEMDYDDFCNMTTENAKRFFKKLF